MSNEEQILSILGSIDTRLSHLEGDVSTLKSDVSTLKSDVSTLKSDMKQLQAKVERIDQNVILIEVEHGQKLAAMYDGYVQNNDRLNRMEETVTRHEILIRKRMA